MKYNIIHDSKDLRDKIYVSPNYKNISDLPSETNNSVLIDWVFDQGQEGSCTANAFASMRMYLLKKDSKTFQVLSRAYIYWHERNYEGTTREDSGAESRDGVRTLKEFGVCLESTMPYNDHDYLTIPSEQAEIEATGYKIDNYYRVPNFDTLKTALADGLTVSLGMIVYESFESDSVASSGIFVTPSKYEQTLGGHEVLIVDYKNDGDTTTFKVLNSWGEEWGQKGYFWITEPQLKMVAMDFWTAV